MWRACANNKIFSFYRSSLGKGSGWSTRCNTRRRMISRSTSSSLLSLCPCCSSSLSLSTATGELSYFRLTLCSRSTQLIVGFFKSIGTSPVSPSFFCIVFASLFVFFKKRLCLLRVCCKKYVHIHKKLLGAHQQRLHNKN